MTDAAYVAHRADAAERRIELAWILAKHTDWRACTSRCGWALLADRGCVSRRTVARFYAWLRAENLLGVVSTGRSAMTRPMALTTPADAGSGVSRTRGHQPSDNEAAVYVLTEPIPAPRPYEPPDPGLLALDPRYATGEITADTNGRQITQVRRGPLTVDEVGTPNGSLPVTSQHAPARACTSCHRLLRTPLRGRHNATPSLQFGGQGPATTWHPTTVTDGDPTQGNTGNLPVLCGRCQATRWPRNTPARTKRDRLALCERLRHDAPVLTWVGNSRRLRWLLRDFLHAGWTAEDLLHALDTHPDTGPYAYATSAPGTRGGLRNPAGWVLHRLKPWRGPDGFPQVSFSATHASAFAHRRAEHLARAATDRRATAAATGPTPAYRAARAAGTRSRPR